MRNLKDLSKYVRSYKPSKNRYCLMLSKSAKIMFVSLLLAFSSSILAQDVSDETRNVLTLQKAKELALKNDDWLVKSQLMQSRLEVLSEGASALPDPTFSLGLLNLPTDGFALDQEPMTQVKIGATQMFPRGDSTALEEKKLKLSASEQPFLRDNRRLKVILQTTHLWLDAFEASASYHLVNKARPLFDKLSEIVSASYASSAGKARQQDIIRAELELVRLNDRLISLDTKKRMALSKLSTFLYSPKPTSAYRASFINQPIMPASLTEINSPGIQVLAAIGGDIDEQSLYPLIETHPLIDATEQRVRASSIDIELAEQAFKPQYAVNASYALRDDAASGQSRADFISIGASISVPLFSKKRQDANLAGAKLMTEAIRTEKLLIMRELMAGLSSAYQEYLGLSERFAIYENTILVKMSQQSEAALNAYTNDSGDFAEVVRAKIAELDAQLTQLNIDISKRKALASIEYFSPESSIAQSSVNTFGATENLISKKDNSHD